MAGRTDEQQQAGTYVSIGSDRRREGEGEMRKEMWMIARVRERGIDKKKKEGTVRY